MQICEGLPHQSSVKTNIERAYDSFRIGPISSVSMAVTQPMNVPVTFLGHGLLRSLLSLLHFHIIDPFERPPPCWFRPLLSCTKLPRFAIAEQHTTSATWNAYECFQNARSSAFHEHSLYEAVGYSLRWWV